MKHKLTDVEISAGWDRLTFFPHPILQLLQHEFRTVNVLYNSFEDQDSGIALVQQITSEADFAMFGDRLVEELLAWREEVSPSMRRLCREKCQRMGEEWSSSREPDSSRAAFEFEEIVRNDPYHALEVAKRKCKQLKKSDNPATRAEKEQAALTKYAYELGLVVQEAGLPVCRYIERLQDPDKAWNRLFGARRANTLRNRVRAWHRFRDWLVATHNRVWPDSAIDLINYVEEARLETPAKSLPGELQASLVVLETCGRVNEGDHLSRDQLWLQHLASWRVEAETGMRPPKSAQPYTVAMIISLELSVLDVEISFYQRLISWVILLSSWASMRLDDVQSILPQSMKLSRRGLTVRLARTKTTGPGKLHGQCHAYVNSRCSITGLDWLTEGFLLWQADTLCYPRDYLVPHPSADMVRYSQEAFGTTSPSQHGQDDNSKAWHTQVGGRCVASEQTYAFGTRADGKILDWTQCKAFYASHHGCYRLPQS